jgi:GxxExxY protein
MTENEISGIVLDKAIKVHKELGPGLLESVYEECLSYELMKSGFSIERQKEIPVIYENIKLKIGYRCDIIVEEKVIIEIKSVSVLADIHLAQTLTYLKLTNSRLGLLINFNVVLLKDGFRRIVNNM